MEEAWRWVSARAFADDRLAGQYVEALVRRKRFEEAAAAWKQHLGERGAGYRQETHLYNGDFEQEASGSIFDWRLSPTGAVRLSIDSSITRSGARSLRIELGGKENVAYCGVAQRTVLGGGAYRIRAYVKAEGLSTDRGPTVRVFDVDSPGRLDVRTEEVTGTQDWRALERTFTVGGGSRLIEVQLSREPSLKFDNKIRGTLWLDEVSLVRTGGR